MENRTKIILTRKSEWMNRSRPYHVLIDGMDAGSIANGSTQEFMVSPGSHTVQCKMAWYCSPLFQVDLKMEEIEYLRVRAGMKYYWPLFFILLVGISINLFYTHDSGEKPLSLIMLQLVCILPSLLYMLYYLTLGKQKYLVIEEDRENAFSK